MRRRQACDDGFEYVFNADAGLGGDLYRVGGINPDHVFDLFLHALWFSSG